MLNDGGNENGKTNTQTKKTTRLISNNNKNNNNFARAAHFFFAFLCRCLARFLEGTSHVLTKNFVSCVPARFL